MCVLLSLCQYPSTQTQIRVDAFFILKHDFYYKTFTYLFVHLPHKYILWRHTLSNSGRSDRLMEKRGPILSSRQQTASSSPLYRSRTVGKTMHCTQMPASWGFHQCMKRHWESRTRSQKEGKNRSYEFALTWLYGWAYCAHGLHSSVREVMALGFAFRKSSMMEIRPGPLTFPAKCSPTQEQIVGQLLQPDWPQAFTTDALPERRCLLA